MTIFTRKYNSREQYEIIKSMIILTDSREKKNTHIIKLFDEQNIKHRVEKLDFGDYTFIIPANEDLGIKEDIHFHNLVSIERKSGIDEVCGNITVGRKRFEAEYARHKGLMVLMIEDDRYSDICEGNYKSKVSHKSLLGTLHKWQIKYDVPFIFVEKQYAGVYICQTFKYYLDYCFDINI